MHTMSIKHILILIFRNEALSNFKINFISQIYAKTSLYELHFAQLNFISYYECAIFAMTLYSYLEAFNTNARARAHTPTTAHPHAHKRPAHTHTTTYARTWTHITRRTTTQTHIHTRMHTSKYTQMCACSDHSTCVRTYANSRTCTVSARRVCLRGIMRPGVMRRGVMRQYVVRRGVM